MKMLVALMILVSSTQIKDKKIELERVCETYSYTDLEEGTTRGTLNTGLVITSDTNYLYIITNSSPLEEHTIFKWTSKEREFTDEDKTGELELKGELIKENLSFALFRTERPSNYRPKLIEFDNAVQNQKVKIAIKDYHLTNKINKYKLISGRVLPPSNLIQCVINEEPIGGGVVFSDDGKVLGWVNGFSQHKKTSHGFTSEGMRNFLKSVSRRDKKDLVPEAPKNDKQ